MDFVLAPMTIADYDAVVRFWRCQEGIGLNESDERVPLERFLARNPDMSLVARTTTGVVIGAVLCGHDGRRGYLHHLAVGKAFRGRGLGRALVERCLAQLASQGIPKCNIFLFDNNFEGRKFWERMGYHRVNWSPMQRVIGQAGE